VPRVNDKRIDESGCRQRLTSAILPPCMCRSPKGAGHQNQGADDGVQTPRHGSGDVGNAERTPHILPLVRAGAIFVDGALLERDNKLDRIKKAD